MQGRNTPLTREQILHMQKQQQPPASHPRPNPARLAETMSMMMPVSLAAAASPPTATNFYHNGTCVPSSNVIKGPTAQTRSNRVANDYPRVSFIAPLRVLV